MKLITRNTDYAIRALCELSKNPERRFTVQELVRDLKIPRPFLRKILQLLGKAGFVESYKGVRGGFSLLKQAGEIDVRQVAEIFQGPLDMSGCFLKKKICPERGCCVLRKRMLAIESNMIAELGGITVADLTSQGG